MIGTHGVFVCRALPTVDVCYESRSGATAVAVAHNSSSERG